jgi:hypothetical protein
MGHGSKEIAEKDADDGFWNNPSQTGLLLEVRAFGSIPIGKGKTTKFLRKSHSKRQVLSR